MAPPIKFSFLFKAYLQQYFRVVLKSFKKLTFTINNVQKIVFK